MKKVMFSVFLMFALSFLCCKNVEARICAGESYGECPKKHTCMYDLAKQNYKCCPNGSNSACHGVCCTSAQYCAKDLPSGSAQCCAKDTGSCYGKCCPNNHACVQDGVTLKYMCCPYVGTSYACDGKCCPKAECCNKKTRKCGPCTKGKRKKTTTKKH